MMLKVLVGGFAGLESHFATFCAPLAAARKLLFHEKSKPEATASEAAFGYPRTQDGDCAVSVGFYMILLLLHFLGWLLRLV